MDPFLEDPGIWPAFHQQMIAVLHADLTSKMSGPFLTRIRERRYAAESTLSPPGVGVERREEYIEICGKNDGPLVTLVDMVSPANKTTGAGRLAYLHTRRQAQAWKANWAEIDLVLPGQPTTDYPREELPDWDYAVTITRITQPGNYEIYPTTLDKELPRIRLPLTATDQDLVLDLQRLVERVYEQGEFAARIGYRNEIAPGLNEGSRRRFRKLLGQATRLTEAHFEHDEIAVAAYYIWMKQGCPEGLADVHWQLAIEQLLRENALQRRR
jgi:hypothetical protein